MDRANYIETCVNLTLRWPRGGGGGVDVTPNRFFQFFSEMERVFCKLNFSCRLMLGTFAHEKIFQIGLTILALKLNFSRNNLTLRILTHFFGQQS